MSVFLDLSAAVHGRAGIGRYSQRLAEALAALDTEDRLAAFYNRPAGAHMPETLDRLRRVTVPWGDKPWRLRVLLAHLMRRSQDALLPGASLFHALDHLLPRLVRVRSVFTLYDLTFVLYPETHSLPNRLFMTWMAPFFLRQAGRIIAISESTRRDAVRRYGLDEARVQVVHGGVDASFRPASAEAIAAVRHKYGLPERFILAVGTIEPRKNLTGLLEAYRALIARRHDLGLVVAGRRGWRAEGFFRRLGDLGLAGKVVLPGFVAEADLPALYSAAELLAFPSLYEGFGLPPLEAMACGTPVVAGSSSSLPEVVGDAGLMVAPRDIRGLAEALAAVVDSPGLRAELRGRGFEQARRFTWEAAAQATWRIYRSVLDERSAR